MGIKERQDRERAAVRNAILHAARELFTAEGYRTVSMRKIAERIEYSPAAIYGYFASKDEIFFALAEEGFLMIKRAAEDAARDEKDPLRALRASLLAYYRFAREQPKYFELMFVDRSVPHLEDLERFGFLVEMVRDAQQSIARCVDDGVFPRDLDVAAAFHILWAAVHGPATLAIGQRLGEGEDPDRLAADTLDATIAGLQTGIKTTFVATCTPCSAPTGANVVTSGALTHAT
jgi:AcrR family transcriptional regulator